MTLVNQPSILPIDNTHTATSELTEVTNEIPAKLPLGPPCSELQLCLRFVVPLETPFINAKCTTSESNWDSLFLLTG